MIRQSKTNTPNDNIKVEMVTADQMTDEDRRAVFDREATVDAIPDLDVLTSRVYEILLYLEKPETCRLLKTNDSAVKMHLNNKYPDVPLGIITVLLEEDSRIENIERILRIFDSLRKAKEGQVSLEDAEKNLVDDVNERYLYRKYGSKEQFEAELAKEVRNEQRKKNGNNAEALRNVGKVRIKH